MGCRLDPAWHRDMAGNSPFELVGVQAHNGRRKAFHENRYRTIGISPEKRDKLIANLAHVDAQQGVFGAIESRARARWKLVPAPAPAPNELIVRLDNVDLRASRERQVALAMTVGATPASRKT